MVYCDFRVYAHEADTEQSQRAENIPAFAVKRDRFERNDEIYRLP